MAHRDEVTRAVRNICGMALQGALSLDDFFRQWPQDAKNDVLFQKIHEDIEDAVEHFPASWRTGKPDYENWENSHTYLVLYLDSILLNYGRSSEELLRAREAILKAKELSRSAIHEKLSELLGRVI